MIRFVKRPVKTRGIALFSVRVSFHFARSKIDRIILKFSVIPLDSFRPNTGNMTPSVCGLADRCSKGTVSPQNVWQEFTQRAKNDSSDFVKRKSLPSRVGRRKKTYLDRAQRKIPCLRQSNEEGKSSHRRIYFGKLKIQKMEKKVTLPANLQGVRSALKKGVRALTKLFQASRTENSARGAENGHKKSDS